MDDIQGGLGSFNVVKVWEIELMLELGEDEYTYTCRSTRNRAMMIAAMKIPKLISVLEENRAYKDAKKKS